MNRPVMIMAGGTGGHVFPALAVAERLRQRGVPLVWLGGRRGLETRLVPAAAIPLEQVSVSGLRGVGLRRRLGAPLMLSQALWQALQVLRRHRPRLVLGMGGFVSGPGGLAARGLRIPLAIHEQNAFPGTTNRWLARVAGLVMEAFPGSFPAARRAELVGNPVRAEIAALAPPAARGIGGHERLRLLVLGGSQGARAINLLLPQALTKIDQKLWPSVWHQTGEHMYDGALNAYRETGFDHLDASLRPRLEPFIDDMAAAYGWADVVLARSGALTVAELCAAGVGALLIPFPHAVDDHQTANAQFMQRNDAAVLLSQDGLDGDRLAAALGALLNDRGEVLRMAEAARALARPDAAERVAALCLRLCNANDQLHGGAGQHD